MIYAITLNPAIDRYIDVNNFVVNTTNYYHDEHDVFGGKAVNVAKILQHFTKEYQLVTKFDNVFEGFIEKDLVDINHHLVLAPKVRVNYKINDGGDITELNKKVVQGESNDSKDVFAYINENVEDDDIVLFGGTLTDFEIELIKELRFKNEYLKIIIDSSSVSLADLKLIKPYFYKPNAEEIAILFDDQAIDQDKLVSYAKELNMMGIEHVVISLGGDGSLYASGDTVLNIGIAKGDVINTVGAGDSFVGGFLSGINNGLKIDETLQLAAACGCATAYSTLIGEHDLILKLKKEIIVK